MKIYFSRQKLLKFFLLGLLMTAASIFVLVLLFKVFLLNNQSLLTDWLTVKNLWTSILSLIPLLGIVMFGGITVTFAARFFDSTPQVIINKDEIEDKRLNFGCIKWQEIEKIYFEENKYAKWLNLFLISPEKYYPKLPVFQKFLRKANGQIGNNQFRIRFNDLETPIEEALKLIVKYYDAR